MLIGYARVSTKDQNLDLQTDALTKAGCEKIFKDKASGKNLEREGLNEAVSHLKDGDTLVVWKLDRLGRSVKKLITFVEELKESKVEFQSVTDGINTNTTAGRFFFHVMASLAQMERELIIERTKHGLEAAKARGRLGGRKRKLDKDKIKVAKKLLKDGMLPKQVAQTLNISIPTLYRWIPASGQLKKL